MHVHIHYIHEASWYIYTYLFICLNLTGFTIESLSQTDVTLAPLHAEAWRTVFHMAASLHQSRLWQLPGPLLSPLLHTSGEECGGRVDLFWGSFWILFGCFFGIKMGQTTLLRASQRVWGCKDSSMSLKTLEFLQKPFCTACPMCHRRCLAHWCIDLPPIRWAQETPSNRSQTSNHWPMQKSRTRIVVW